MFDLEVSVAAWKQALASRDGLRPEALDELEDHLRVSFDQLSAESSLKDALTPDERFALAARRLGDTRALATEFERADPSAAVRRRWIWMLAGFVGIHLASQVLLTASVIVSAITAQTHPRLSSVLFALTMLGGALALFFAARSGAARSALDRVARGALHGSFSTARTVALGGGALLAGTLITPLGRIVSARYLSVGRFGDDPSAFASPFGFALEQAVRVIAFAAPFVLLTVLSLRERAHRSDATTR